LKLPNRTRVDLSCKHVGALLLALVVLKDHSEQLKPPDDMRRSNMKRFDGMSDSVVLAVGANLTWSDIVSQLLVAPPHSRDGVSTKDKFLVEPKVKKKVLTHPATLEAMKVAELKDVLKSLNLSSKGKKAELINRIVANRPIPPPGTVSNTTSNSSIKKSNNTTTTANSTPTKPIISTKSLTPLKTINRATSKTKIANVSAVATKSKKRKADTIVTPVNVKRNRTLLELQRLNDDTTRYLRSLTSNIDKRISKPNVRYS